MSSGQHHSPRSLSGHLEIQVCCSAGKRLYNCYDATFNAADNPKLRGPPLDTPGEWDPVAGLGSKKALTIGPTAVDLQGGGGAELCLHLGPLTDGTVSTDPKAGCSCSQDESSSLPGVVVGIHVGLAALIICLLCLLLGWRPQQ